MISSVSHVVWMEVSSTHAAPSHASRSPSGLIEWAMHADPGDLVGAVIVMIVALVLYVFVFPNAR